MTKEQRDQLRAACKNYAPGTIISLGSTIDSFHAGEASFTLDELRALLDSDERLEAARPWLEEQLRDIDANGCYPGLDSGFRACLRMVLNHFGWLSSVETRSERGTANHAEGD